MLMAADEGGRERGRERVRESGLVSERGECVRVV